jgi:hypothetical protein
MADSVTDALKTFLVWKGIAHLVMLGYALLTGFIILSAWRVGTTLTTQQTFMVGTMTGVLPVMLNWYIQVMAMTQRESKA